MKNIPLLAIITLLLTSCGGAESDARKAVLGSLKDPDSAKFGKFTQVNDKSACLTVNARNSMGGYTGDQQASLIKQENAWVVIDIDERSHEMCIDAMKGISDATVPASEKVAKTGEEVVKGCAMCHEAGLMNAPKLGDKAQWEPRIAQGYETLVKHAIEGIRAMPAKGGNPDLSDAEIAAAVAEMANQAGANFDPAKFTKN